MSINSFLISNISLDDNHEDNIRYLLKNAKTVKIISPYVTIYGVEFVLKNVNEEANIELITELSVAGIMGGSQSPKSLERLLSNTRAEIYYYTSNLHSKVFIIDDNIIVTSANLTKGGLVTNMESGLTINSYLKDKIASNLMSRFRDEINAYWNDIIKKAIYLDQEEIEIWKTKEDELLDEKKKYSELISQHSKEMPRKEYRNFERNLEGRDFITELSASSKEIKLPNELWNSFRHSYSVNSKENLNQFRYMLDEKINPILDDIFSLIKLNKSVSVNITNLSYSFSKNLQAKFFPNYRYLFITKRGIGGDNRKRHIEYPTYILSLGIDGDRNWFEIRSGVEEENTPRLCQHARHFLESIRQNIDECINRLHKMGKGWAIIHGDGKKDERKIVPAENLSKEQLLGIINQYLVSGDIADMHISRKYYKGEDDVLENTVVFIESLAKDLNELNYFFELAHF